MQKGIFLGEYPDELKKEISTLGGKLGFLQFLKSRPDLVVWVEKLGFTIAPHLFITDEQWNLNDADTQKFKNHLHSLHPNKREVMVRGSVDADFRGLVDIIPTDTEYLKSTSTLKEAISELVKRAHESLRQDSSDIKKYTRGMWLPWGKSPVRFGVTSFIDCPVLTATEHPNSSWVLLLDTWYKDLMLGGKEIDSQLFMPERSHPWHQTVTIKMLDVEKRGNKITTLLAYLRDEKVLDKDIVYQLELGIVRDELVIFQIREFCKRQEPILFQSDTTFQEKGRTFFSSLKDGEKLELTCMGAKYPWDWTRVHALAKKKVNILLTSVSPGDLWSHEYHQNIRAYMHTDAHNWALNHASFRTTQSVIQAGWFVGLGACYAHGLDFHTGLSVTLSRDGDTVKAKPTEPNSRS